MADKKDKGPDDWAKKTDEQRRNSMGHNMRGKTGKDENSDKNKKN